MDVITDNITLDCEGYTIDGTDNSGSYGILTNAYSTTVKNCSLNDWANSIYYNNSNDGLIQNVTVTSHSNFDNYAITIRTSDNNQLRDVIVNQTGTYYYGILISASNNTKLTNVNITTENRALYFSGSCFNNLVSDSTLIATDGLPFDLWPNLWVGSWVCDHTFTNVLSVNNKPIVYFNNTNVTIRNWDNNASYILLCNADNSVIDNVTMSDSYGIRSWAINNANYSNINVYNNRNSPLYFRFNGGNRLTNITVTNEEYGLIIFESDFKIFPLITLK